MSCRRTDQGFFVTYTHLQHVGRYAHIDPHTHTQHTRSIIKDYRAIGCADFGILAVNTRVCGEDVVTTTQEKNKIY